MDYFCYKLNFNTYLLYQLYSFYLLLEIGREYPFSYILFDFLYTPETSAIQLVAGMYLAVVYGFVYKHELFLACGFKNIIGDGFRCEVGYP